MASSTKNNFTTLDEIWAEFRRQEVESDEEFNDEISDIASESDDGILSNNDFENDEFELDEENDFLVENPQQHDDRNFEIGRDGETIWTDKPMISPYSRTPSSNIVTHLPGPKGEVRGIKDEVKLFSHFITREIIEKIVSHTNQSIEQARLRYSSPQRYTGNTDADELKALIGLLFMSAVLKNSGLNPKDMFSTLYGPPIFRCTMSIVRFYFLLTHIRFDDKSTRDIRKKSDKFAPFREIWDIFSNNCSKNYSLSEYATVDETLLSFRGKCPFKTYIPSKPDKYGLKIITLCDARTFYFYQGIPYIGKEQDKRKKGDIPLPAKYVIQLTDSLQGSKRNITADNWFASLELTDELLQRKLTFVGTLRKNKPQIPPFLLSTAPAGSARFAYQDDKMLVSYSPKKNKCVLLISSMHFKGEINEQTKKPEIVELYNLTKGGVDVLDKLCHDKTTKRKTRRWPLRYFYGVLDIAAVNTYVLYKLNRAEEYFPKDARNYFLKKLAEGLTKTHMEKRWQNKYIPKELRLTIGKLLGKEEKVLGKTNVQQQKRKRCQFCDSSKDRKGNFFCNTCNACVCGEHKIISCPNCFGESDVSDTDM